MAALRFLILSVVSAGAAFASGPWLLPFFTASPQAVLAAAAKIHPPGARDLALLDSDCAMKINEQGRALTTCRFLFRPQSNAGVEMLGTFQVPWAEWREQRPSLRIRVIAPDGPAREMDPSRVTESGQAAKVIEAPLPPVAVNGLVEIETVAQDRETAVPGSRFAYFEPDNLPIGHWRASIEAPASMTLRVKMERLPGAVRTDARVGPSQKVTIEFSDAAIRTPASASPPEWSAPPRVAIAAGPGWETIAAWYAQAVEAQAGRPEPGFFAGSETQRATVVGNALAGFETNRRFNGVDLGPVSLLPRAPNESAGPRAGDSLELAVALVARLRSAGVPANVALLTPFPGPDAEPDMPGIEAFTRAVVYAPGRTPLWIDPAEPFATATQLPVADQGRMALIARAGVRELVRTPVADAAENRFTEYQNITLTSSGRGQIDEIEDGQGYFATAFRTAGSALKAAAPADREQYEKSLAAAYGFEKTLQSDVVNLNDLTKPVRLVFSGAGYKYAVTEGGAARVWVPEIAANGAAAGGVLNPLFAARKQNPSRTEDYWAVTRAVVERRIRIAPPKGFRLAQLPELKPAPIGPLTYTRMASALPDGAVEIVYHLEIPRNRFTPAEVAAMAADIARLEALPMLCLTFTAPGYDAAAADAGLRHRLQPLLALRDYAQAADLLAGGGPDDEASARLRRTRRQEDVRDSDDPVIAVAQELIRGLLDPTGRRPWQIYYAAGSAAPNLDSQRARLLDLLTGYRSVAGVTLDLPALADVALSNLQLSATALNGIWRVRFPDPAHGGALTTLGRFIREGDAYRTVGIGEAAQ